MKINELKLKDLQPSQFYISEKKLRDIEGWLNPADLSCFEPIPVKLLDGRPVMTDGHTRAVAALRAGLEAVPLVWDEDELPWDMYRACVAACREQAIASPIDLLSRIISEAEYRERWDKWCDRMQAEVERNRIVIKPYTEEAIPDVLSFERALRAEEDFWGWEIDAEYIKSVTASFHDNRFSNALSFLAYQNERVIGRIDAVLIPSHFDGSIKAYLDWICVLKSCRHKGAAQKLLSTLREKLKAQHVDTLIAHNLEILRGKLDGSEPITTMQGNALDFSLFHDNSFDLTMLLGPMYHLYTKKEKLRALSEAVRVTKHNGYILVAYCMNEPTVIQYLQICA